jgi:hypothetical protein
MGNVTDNNVLGLSLANMSNYGGSYIPTIDDITANPEAFANYDFSGMAAGSLATPANKFNFGDNMGNMLGGAQIGLGLLSYLENRKTANLQRGLMKQQMANNDKAVADHDTFVNSWSGGSAAQPSLATQKLV